MAVRKKDWPDYGKSENTIKKEVFNILAKYGDVLSVFRNNVGTWNDGKSFVRYGLAPGSPDIVCIMRGSIFVGIECKSLTGKESEEQRRWRLNFCERLGIHHIVAIGTSDKSAADVVESFIKDILGSNRNEDHTVRVNNQAVRSIKGA